jgi:hypothetical protein
MAGLGVGNEGFRDDFEAGERDLKVARSEARLPREIEEVWAADMVVVEGVLWFQGKEGASRHP